jgi:hypothetical protein
MRPSNDLTLLPKSLLLTTESVDEFDGLRDAFEREIKPRGIIELMYVHDICAIVWEILRLRCAKAAIINAAFRDALVNILIECLAKPGKMNLRAEATTLAGAWFKDEQGKKQVAEILNQRGFDEYVIKAEAFRKSSSTLEQLGWPRWRRVAIRRFAASTIIAWHSNCARAQIGSLTDKISHSSKRVRSSKRFLSSNLPPTRNQW